MISGAYAPFGTGVGWLAPDGSVTLGATFGSISAMASIDLRMPLPIAVPRARGQTLDGDLQRLLVGGGRLDQLGVPGEGDDADLRARLLALDERQGGRLGGLQAAGLNIGLAHAARDVEGEDDRRLAGRHAHDLHRAGQRDDQAGQRQEEQGKGQMAPQPRIAGQRRAHQRQAGVAQRRPAAGAAPRYRPRSAAAPVPAGAGTPAKVSLIDTLHCAGPLRSPTQGKRPSHSSDNAPPISKTRMPAPANSAVTSVFCGLITSCGLRLS